MRLDAYLVEHGHFVSRARAQGAVKAGLVRINGRVSDKPAASVPSGAVIAIEGDVHPYVSRGGLKLEAALEAFAIEPTGRICLDLGASTGGFTEVLLQRSAAKVYAVDVGTAQLHASLASDPRVVNLERTNAKDLSRALIHDAIDLLVCDVSFISLTKALPPAMALCATSAEFVALVKPQFEMGREKIGKGGIVTASPGEIQGMIESVNEWLAGKGWRVTGFIESPILGGDGNEEFLIGAIRP